MILSDATKYIRESMPDDFLYISPQYAMNVCSRVVPKPQSDEHNPNTMAVPSGSTSPTAKSGSHHRMLTRSVSPCIS